MDIGPGDWVECVDASPHAGAGLRRIAPLTRHKLYCVRGCLTINNRTGLYLMSINNPRSLRNIEFAYIISRFRPFHGPEIEREKWREKLPERSMMQKFVASLPKSNHTTPPQLSPEP